MASLNWRIRGINRDQIAIEIATLRANSPTFRRLEQLAWDRGYRSAEVTMGSGLHKWSIADSVQSDKDPSVRQMWISSDATGTFGINGRQITVAEIIAHELAHGVIPPDVAEPGKIDFNPKSREELWARRQTGAVAVDLGFGGPNNADFQITYVPIDREQACAFGNINGNTARDGVLFLDGSRGSNGLGSTSPGRSGSLDQDMGPVRTAFGPGNSGLGSAAPVSTGYQRPGSGPLLDWLQSALPDIGARLPAGTLPPWPSQPFQAQQFAAPPPTPSIPQQPSAPPPNEELVPEVFKPLVRHLFPEGLNNRAFWAPGSPDSPSPTNSAGSAGASPGLASTPSPLPSAASLPDFPIPAPLLPLLRLFAPREPTD